MAAIFISHSSLDAKAADEIKALLGKLGFERIFLDFDKHDGIGAGENWERRLYHEIARCHAVMLVLTPNWLASKWCFVELAQARALGKVILPVICEPLGTRTVLPEIQAVDLLDWSDDGLNRLEQRLNAITHDLARGFTLHPSRPPFPGIHAFEAEDAAIYFGRDDETRTTFERLEARRRQGGARLLFIIGASGSGKSSLLKAGVLPQLARRRREWIVLEPIRPEKAPVETLAKSISQQLGRPAEWRAWHERLTSAGALDHVEELIKDLRIGDARGATVLLPIDQFEEVFTVAAPAERDTFLGLLTTALDPKRALPLMAVATGRSDVLDGLIEAGALAHVTESHALPLMPLERVKRLVEGPAAVAGLNVDPGLAERIERDLETAEALPLLAHTLWLLHNRGHAGKRLSLAEYESLGDPARGLNPIQNSVRLVADEALAGTNPTEHELAALRDAFVPHLVRVRLEDGKRVRQVARMADLPNDAHRLIQALIDARLLIAHARTPSNGEAAADGKSDAVVEVAHEALFKAWPTLDRWLTEEHGFLTDLERIRGAHEVWSQAADDQKSAALLRGLLLSRARDWLIRYPQRFVAQEMEDIRAFIAASAHAEDAERLIAEAQRERTRRMERRMFRGAIAAAIVFAIIAAVAGREYVVAEKERTRAEAALERADKNYAVALGSGSEIVQKVQDLLLDGSLTAPSAQALLDIPRRSAGRLVTDGDNDEITGLELKLMDVLSRAYLTVPGQGEHALEVARRMRDLAQQQFTRAPTDAGYGRNLATGSQRVADALEAQGKLAEAFKFNDEARRVVDELIKLSPSDPYLIMTKGLIHQRLGDIRNANGDVTGALGDFRVYVATFEGLAARPQPQPIWLRGFAISHQRIGDIAIETGRLEEALTEYRAYQAAAERLVALEASGAPNLTWRLDLAIAHQRIGDVLLEQKKYGEALQEFQIYAKGAETATRRDPDKNEWQRFLGNSYIGVGDALIGLGRIDEAIEQFRAAVAIYEWLASADKLRARWRRTLAITHQRIGKALLLKQDPKALEEFQACLDIDVDETAIEPQIRTPRHVQQECRTQMTRRSEAR
jgi:tetratricopeptide (TPR) repeat protein